MVEKKCKNCQDYRPHQGMYGSGLCVSSKSTRGNKSFTLTSDSCKCFKENK